MPDQTRAGFFGGPLRAMPQGLGNRFNLPTPATALLTLTANAVDGETVTIGTQTYTWKNTVAAIADQVLVGATAAASLVNLKAAVNLEAGAGTLYGSGTAANTSAKVQSVTSTTAFVVAIVGGSGGNTIASTETMTNGSFGGATFSGGADVVTFPYIVQAYHYGHKETIPRGFVADVQLRPPERRKVTAVDPPFIITQSSKSFAITPPQAKPPSVTYVKAFTFDQKFFKGTRWTILTTPLGKIEINAYLEAVRRFSLIVTPPPIAGGSPPIPPAGTSRYTLSEGRRRYVIDTAL